MSYQVEKTISTIIKNDFPSFYDDEGSLFVDFIMAYYEWMEKENNTIYHSRRYLDYRDIDTTVDQFILHFKEKYLDNITINSSTNTKLLVKHALDIYRSKGTDRSVKLLFSLLFRENVDIYYPKTDIFSLSSATWSKNHYIEVDNNYYNILYLNKAIKGSASGATAYVERIVKKKVNTKFIEVFYLSSINGEFITGEKVMCDDLFFDDYATVIGSLSTVDIIDGGFNFAKGDRVNFESVNGSSGLGLVTNVATYSGLVNFTLADGGWGYTSNSQVLISDNVLFLNSAVQSNTSNTLYSYFENIVQPLCNVYFTSANAVFANNDYITQYYANGSIRATGYVINCGQLNSNGYILISNTLGTFTPSSNIYSFSNTKVANTYSCVDLTATANVVGMYSNVIIYTNSNTSPLLLNENLYQIDTNNHITFSASYLVGNSTAIVVKYNYGNILTSNPILSTLSNTAITPTSISVGMGVKNEINTFYPSNTSYSYTSNFKSANIYKVSKGYGASFKIGMPLTNQENMYVNEDYVKTYANTKLNANNYGFPALPTANSGSKLFDCFTTAYFTFGTISYLSSVNGGVNYDSPPTISVYEPVSYNFGKKDYTLTLSSMVGTFTPGEFIQQNTTNAKAIVKYVSNNSLYVKRINIESEFNTTDTIIGLSSGATAIITNVGVDLNSNIIGLNATITGNTITANGYVTSIDVIDTGYGYLNSEILNFTSLDGSRSGLVKTNVNKQGYSRGEYLSQNGFLSSTKKLYDAYYYQNYSYDIKSTISLDVYSDVVKNIVHVAGTVFYGTFHINNIISATIPTANSVIT